MEVDVVSVSAIDDKLLADIQRLHSQVASSSAPNIDELTALITQPGTVLFVARERDVAQTIRGMLTIVSFRVPSGLRVWIEDVVVDESARRRGIGEALNRRAVDYARSLGARTVDLTSRPSRVAANLLYLKLGFERRNTNVYRLTL